MAVFLNEKRISHCSTRLDDMAGIINTVPKILQKWNVDHMFCPCDSLVVLISNLERLLRT